MVPFRDLVFGFCCWVGVRVVLDFRRFLRGCSLYH
jgi:hypothetical protein